MVGEEGCCPSVVAICYLEDAAACHPASRLAGVHSSPGFHDKSRLLGLMQRVLHDLTPGPPPLLSSRLSSSHSPSYSEFQPCPFFLPPFPQTLPPWEGPSLPLIWLTFVPPSQLSLRITDPGCSEQQSDAGIPPQSPEPPRVYLP